MKDKRPIHRGIKHSWFHATVTGFCSGHQGHPMTVFHKMSVRRGRWRCLGFSISWEQLKISRWPFHSGNFWSLSNKCRTIFLSLIFHISLPRLGYFSAGKRKPKIWGFMERGIRKILTFVIYTLIASKIFKKIKLTSPWNCEDTQVLLRWPNRYKIYSTLLRMHL